MNYGLLLDCRLVIITKIEIIKTDILRNSEKILFFSYNWLVNTRG